MHPTTMLRHIWQVRHVLDLLLIHQIVQIIQRLTLKVLLLLKPELMRAVVDCGFEHPSEVQHECIPQAVLGMDVICQAKSGMGKTAVFVLTTLHQLDPVDGKVHYFTSIITTVCI